MTYLILISSFLALFLSILVLFKKRRSYSDNLLFAWLLFIALHTVLEYLQLYNSEQNYPFPRLIGVTFSFPAIHPILIFLYILSYIRPGTRNSKVLWHIVPVIVLNIVFIKTFYLKTGPEKIITFNNALLGTGYDDKPLELSTYLVICITMGYLIACFWFLQKHIKSVRNQFSTLEGKDLKWLRRLLYSATIILLISILFELTTNYFNITSQNIDNTIIYLSLTAGLFYLGLCGIRQTDIFVDFEPVEKEVRYSRTLITDQSGKRNGENIIDSDDDNRRKLDRLIRFMEEEKPYLDSTLNLAMLSKQIGFKPHFLSHLVNEFGGKNFFDFVNSYRIEEFKLRAGQPANQNYTLISIAYDCGFNSKATFNRVFRNYTRQTPSDYFHSLHRS
ncbi:helix-turn-helix domain-containing protein [Bacteroidota bacterium]